MSWDAEPVPGPRVLAQSCPGERKHATDGRTAGNGKTLQTSAQQAKPNALRPSFGLWGPMRVGSLCHGCESGTRDCRCVVQEQFTPQERQQNDLEIVLILHTFPWGKNELFVAATNLCVHIFCY